MNMKTRNIKSELLAEMSKHKVQLLARMGEKTGPTDPSVTHIDPELEKSLANILAQSISNQKQV